MIEIERKYLVKSLPEGLTGEIVIQQGYLAHDEQEHLEIRLRRYGKKHFLTVKEGAGLSRRETELEITLRQFDQLWPYSEGRRLEKKRSCVWVGGYKVEVDQYMGDLEPLVVAEVEFSSVEESERFEKPLFMGREVTGVDAYKNLFLALHGMPESSETEQQIGAFPYLMRGGRLYIVLVTNSTQTRWIIPKGQPEPDMSRHDVAVMEAMEEAGVIGSCTPRFYLTCRQKGGRTLQVYPLKVTTILKKWPEMGWRKRMVVSLNKALKMITDPELSECVQRLAHRLLS
jgi:CYTH domain-containing protein